MGRKKDAALKGRLYTRKKKNEGGLKSRPYTEGKSRVKSPAPTWRYPKAGPSLRLPARGGLGMTEGDFSGICQEDFGASDLGGSGLSAGFSAGLSLSDGFDSGCF